MFYGNSIEETRAHYFLSWEKYQNKQPLSSLEDQIVQVILEHPEYHPIFNNRNKFQEHNYYPALGESNPFLHLGLHLAIRDQIKSDRPLGIAPIYNQLLKKYHHPLTVEHLLMEQLAECLWLSQRNNTPPDEKHYLSNLVSLAK